MVLEKNIDTITKFEAPEDFFILQNYLYCFSNARDCLTNVLIFCLTGSKFPCAKSFQDFQKFDKEF
jgi:hypothetical protein